VLACGQRKEPAAQPLAPVAVPVAPATVGDAPPGPDDGVYVRACSLSGLKAGKLKIESDHRVSLVDGVRTVATGETEHDFHARQVEASCAGRSITLQLETAHAFRDVTLVWKHRQLIETSSAYQRQ
jgi:hypothetical protein